MLGLNNYTVLTHVVTLAELKTLCDELSAKANILRREGKDIEALEEIKSALILVELMKQSRLAKVKFVP